RLRPIGRVRLPPIPDQTTGTTRPRDHRTTRPQNSPQDDRTRLVVSGLVVPWSWSGFGRSLTLPGWASLWVFVALLWAAAARGQSHTNLQTVFLLLMENVNWPTLKTNASSAPYLVNTLLPMASSCDQFYTPPGLPGGVPNYFWLEAGTNYGITDSSDPSAHLLPTTNHLTTHLRDAGISW